MKVKGIFNGYLDGIVGLDKEMICVEFVKVIIKLFGLKEIIGVYFYNDKNYNVKNWVVFYIEVVIVVGIMEGKNVEKKIFDFNGKVIIVEMVIILICVLDLEILIEINNNVVVWVKGYV